MEGASDAAQLEVSREVRFTAVLLAAGASTRFGGTPKALLRLGTETAVGRMIRLALSERFGPVLVVVGAHEREIGAEAQTKGAIVIPNRDWSQGRTGSVQVGVAQVDRSMPTLLWPVDHPFVEAKTLRTLREYGMTSPMGLWFIPTFEGRGGHPVLLMPGVYARLQALPSSAPLRDLLPGLGPQVLRIPVPDPGVVANVDIPDDYERHLRDWERRGGT